MRDLVSVKAADFEEVDNALETPAVIPVTVGGALRRGLLCSAIGVSVHATGEQRYIVIALALDPAGPNALYQPLAAATARSLAAALLRSADELDGGKGKQ